RVARTAACRDRQAPIAHCLDRRRGELVALVDRWEPGARDVLALAPQAIDALLPVESCRAPETTATLDRPELAASFASARAERLAGHFSIARAAAHALLPRITDPALRAEVLVELATTQRDLGDGAGARTRLVEAIAAAELAGASRTKVIAWMSLAELASQDLIELSRARDALQLAAAGIERLGSPATLARGLDFERGLLLIREGHPSEAIVGLEHSLTPDLAPTEAAHRLLAVARAQLDMGSFADALARLERAERTLIAALGPHAASLAAIENSMIEPLRMLDRGDEAIARGERALAILTANEGPTSGFRRGVLNNLANVYADTGKLDRAIAIQTELLAGAATDYDRALFESNLGSTLTQAHRHAEAYAHLQRGRALIGKVLGDDHPSIANVEHLLALLEIDRSRPDRALAHARRVLEIRERTHADPGYLGSARYLVAQLLVETGERAEALALARAALAEPLRPMDHQLESDLRAFLAHETRR
ncbi:MAG: tetratricopeptide repeat protein, partial [Kofleriaceae bacterium]